MQKTTSILMAALLMSISAAFSARAATLLSLDPQENLTARSEPSAAAQRRTLLENIESWKVFFADNPKNALSRKYNPGLRLIKEDALKTHAEEDIAPVQARFKAWQSALLADLYQREHGRFASEKSFGAYMQKRLSVLSARHRQRVEAEARERAQRLKRVQAEIARARSVWELNHAGPFSSYAAAEPAAAVAAWPSDRRAFGGGRDAPEVAYPTPVRVDVPAPSRADEVADNPNVVACPRRYAALRARLIGNGVAPSIVNEVFIQAGRQNVNPVMVFAVMKAESHFNPHATSAVGARGLMQIMPDTGRGLGVNPSQLYNPLTNIKLGIHYLKGLWDQFCDVAFSELGSVNPWERADVKKAIAAYNAGPGAVKKYGKVPPYRETRQYVARVLRYYSEMSRAAQGA